MYTIRELCKRSGLSRTALLYYESIGLLTAEARSESNYRLYSDKSAERLEKICTYRDAGVPLAEIVQILSHENSEEREILERTLQMLNVKAKEIKESRKDCRVAPSCAMRRVSSFGNRHKGDHGIPCPTRNW